ncbi:hypothetical protein PHMEG_00020639 [Phytophthora megakarya]|uniref:RNA-directed DNA polymerase n=1 Tax=Phytophthora megakarya TaxID=4795 RepID=A0A225VNL8_9STRA|nr:hypothetical protein PHMEG_00020639 [Phytophthora megakarya]
MAEPGGSKTGLNRTIGEEKEEFEKELEERLFPLDEVELKKRVKANEEQKKELSLAELSCILGIPEDILVRTRESSPGELSKPEYWIKWYASTLASSEAAKRANRDFNNAPQDGDTMASVSPSAKGDSDERDVGGGKKKFRRSRKREKERTKKFLVQRDPVDTAVFRDNIGLSTVGSKKSGLRELPGQENGDETDENAIVPEGKRVIGSVGGVEAVSTGYIDCLPTNMLIDSGAVASLIDYRVLKRLGMTNAPLKPYPRGLKGVSGQELKVRGVVRLPMRLGSRKLVRRFMVIDKLHVDVILGTDTLRAYRAVVDLDTSTVTLKDTGETFPIGSPRVEEMYTARISSTVRLCPGGQALVVSDVLGDASKDATVLVEGYEDLDEMVRVARTLCTMKEGKIVVEVCNASEEDVIIKKGTLIAAATVVPRTAFSFENEGRTVGVEQNASAGETELASSTIVSAEVFHEPPADATPALGEEQQKEFNMDFSASKLTAEQQGLFSHLLESFADMFVETSMKPGRTDLLEFSIDTGDNAPIKQRSYRVSKAEGDVMEAEIQQYLNLGIIRPSSSPWASPTERCHDQGLLPYAYILAKLFSTMDIASGYWNVPMAEDSVAFERLMENVLIDLKWRTCLVYLDDCVVFSEDFPTHLVRLKQVLERFRAAGFKLKMKKRKWGRDQVAFLGHIVTPSGILPNPEKVKSVMTLKNPHDLHTVRAFLGLTSYFRRYIPGYAAITAPIERLKGKGVPFHWSEDWESAFRQLKRKLAEPPILVYPNFSKRFKLYVDSSTFAIGACLMQTVEGRERVVAYASKLLVGSEKNWVNKTNGTSEIECWGIVWATRKFRCYLDRREFDLYTDQKALAWVFDEKNRTSNAKLARWAMELSQLRFKVFHKPGTSMGHVDGLSRLHAETINAVTMADLLNDADPGGDSSDEVGGTDTRVPAEEGTVRETRSVPAEGTTRNNDLERRGSTEVGGGSARSPRPPQDPGQQLMVSPVDLFGLQQERFVEEQKRTPWIMAMLAYLKDGALALDPQLRTRTLLMAPSYEVKNGVLMRKVHLKARAGPASSIEVPVIPLPFISTVLHHCHTDMPAAHVGVTKTLDKVRKACMDAIGPLVTTPRGNKFILVFADYLTRWVEAFAIEALDTVTFVETMVNEVISRHGVPERLLSDQGSNFISELARSFYETLGIKKLFGAAYHPQTQGFVERFNGTLIGMLKMFVNDAQTDWDLYLPRVLFAYRTSYHEALKDSPFFSLYGRDPVLPLDLAFLNTDSKWKSNEVAVYRRRLYLSLRDTKRMVERQLLKAQGRHALRLGDQVEAKFSVGDPVWVYQYFRARRGERATKKLAFSWHGPYRIVSAVGENTYRVAIPTHPNRVVNINVNRLKLFRERWSRPFPTEVPEGVDSQPGVDDEGPLEEEGLPSTSYVERLVIGGEESAISGTNFPVIDILAKRKEKGTTLYLVLLATYEVAWRPVETLLSNYSVLIKAFDDAYRKEKGLPELRRRARLAEANVAVDEDSILF